MIPWILAVLILSLQEADTAHFRILGLADEKNPHILEYIKEGVEYVNEDHAIRYGRENGELIELHTALTMDNDSLSAMNEVCDRLSDGIDIIFDMTSRYVTLTLRSLANALGILHVASVDPSFYERDDRKYNTSINIVPPSNSLLQSIRAIVKDENLTNVGIIYDHTFDFDDKPKRLLRNIPAQHMYLRMDLEVAAINEQLDRIKKAELSHLFLACNSTNANRYLGAAYEKAMMNFKYHWYVLTGDARLSCDACGEDSKAVLITADLAYDPKMRFLEQKQMNYQSDQIQVEESFVFDLVVLVGSTLETVREEWVQTNFTPCTDFVDTNEQALSQALALRDKLTNSTFEQFVAGEMTWHGYEGSIDVHLTIKRVHFGGGNRIKIGSWSKANGLNGSVAEVGLKKSYRIVTVPESPFVFKSRQLPKKEGVNYEYYYTEEDGGWYYYGYCIDLIYHINESMRFDFTIKESSDGAYGTMQSDGSWTGMVNDLIQDEADIIVAPFSVMAERENVIDFTVPYYDLVGITILMKKPPFGYSVFKFMSVLEEAVWGCVLSAFIIVSILLAVFDRYSPYSYQNNKSLWDGKGEEPRVFTLKEGLWFCMTSLTPQGGGEAPRALSGRLLAATWWVFGFIMIATYTANLAAFLTVSRLEQPIESLDDLAKQFKTKYAPQESTATETYFRRMADIEAKFYTIWKDMSLNDSLDEMERAKLAVWDYPVSDKFTNMWASMESSGFPKTFKEATKRIKNPGDDEEFAFIGDATQNKYATLTDCNLWEVGEEFSRKPYALAVQEGSPLKNELSSRILQLLNQRVLEDLKTKWWEFDRKDCPRLEDESDGISIYNIGGVFLVIFIGIGLGLITLAFEYYWYKWRPAAKQKHKQNGSTITNGTANHNGISNGIIDDRNGFENDAYDGSLDSRH